MKTILYPQASTRSRSSVVVSEPTPVGTTHTPLIPKTVTQAPLLFRLAKTMTRWGIRGGTRLLGIFGQLGMLNVVAQYQLGRGVSFSVPLFRADSCWDKRDLEEYERQLIQSFCGLLEPLFDVVLFDCGADIGTFSALVCSQTSRVTRVIAFEPNRDVAGFMKRNLSQLPISSNAVTKAVGCCKGTGRLEFPTYDNSDYARFLVPGDGPLEVVTIDSFELEVLKGAAETISSAQKCVITVEANPRVATRTKRDPVECLRFLQSLRPFRFVIAETKESLVTSSPIIKDGEKDNRNVIGWTP
jgi:hypothetical protein